MVFKKGHFVTEETKRKAVENRIKNGSYKLTAEQKNKRSINNKKLVVEGKHNFQNCSKETRRKGVLTRMKNGSYKHTEEQKRKISLGNKGKNISEETKKKMVATRRKNGTYKIKEETRIKMSNAHKGKETSEETKKKLRLATISYFKNLNGWMRPNIGHNEKQILDNLEQEIGYKIVRQFECEGYFIDGYIPELNLCVEIDEKHHQRNKEKDLIRQSIITNKLGCSFMRINDFN